MKSPAIPSLFSSSFLPASVLPGVALIVASLSFTACKGEIEEAPPKIVVEPTSNIVKITTATIAGQQVACADVFPDTAIFSEKMKLEVGAIKDLAKNNSSATMVCSLIRAGEVPEAAEQDEEKELKTLEEKYAKLGVLPGDSYCQISAYCSLSNDDDTFKQKCKEDGNQATTLNGGFACLRITPKGPVDSYTYKFIEPDTRCLIEALAGPSVSDQELVKNCASAAHEAITASSMKNAK